MNLEGTYECVDVLIPGNEDPEGRCDAIDCGDAAAGACKTDIDIDALTYSSYCVCNLPFYI